MNIFPDCLSRLRTSEGGEDEAHLSDEQNQCTCESDSGGGGDEEGEIATKHSLSVVGAASCATVKGWAN